MQAVVQDRYGEADVLALRDIEVPVPGDDDVLIRVRAAGDLAPDDRPPLPGAGDGLRFKPGDEVHGTVEGSFEEFACASATRIARKPGNLTFEHAVATRTFVTLSFEGGTRRHGVALPTCPPSP